METALTALASHGTVALLAGLIVIVLWKKLGRLLTEFNRLRAYYEGDPEDATGAKIGLIRQLALDAQNREDKLREHYEAALKVKDDAQNATIDDFINTLRGATD